MEYVSEEGLEKLKQDLHRLKTEKRKEIAKKLEQAKALGDLSENAEYQEAKEEQSFIESQIAELEDTIRNAVLIQKKGETDTVQVGSTIRVRSRYGEESYTIVGSEEANPAKGKISNESPLGKMFLGKRAGGKIMAKTPAGETEYEILEIQ